MNGNVIRTITIRGTSEGLDKVTADLNKLASAQENVAVVSEQSAKRVLSLEDAWKRQTLKLDEAARAQANIARETKIADAALREGVATQAQHAQRLEQINQRYSTTTKATADFGKQTGLARHELINLGRQAQDVGVSLASGQSPLMVLAQQGSQIADVFISSGKSVGDLFSQAISWAGRFLTSTAGIVTAIAAIGAAAVYTAYQFLKSSTTIEEALENQNRLMKEGIELAKSRDQSQFEMMRNQVDLQKKLQDELKKTAAFSERRPTSVAQDVGAALGIIAPPKQDPGYAAIADAVQKLNGALATGQGSAQAYGAELSRIAGLHPELGRTVEKLLIMNETGIKLEASLRAAGVSLAQLDLNKLQARDAAAATERRAVATLEIARAYPGMSIETAKQLSALQGQLAVAEQTTELGKIDAQYEAQITDLKLKGLELSEATALADAQRSVALAKIYAKEAQRVEYLQTNYELQERTSDAVKGAANETRSYTSAVETNSRGLASWSAQHDEAVLAANRLTNSINREADALTAAVLAQRAYFANLDKMSYVPTIAQSLGAQLYQSKQGGYSQFNPEGYTSTFKDPSFYLLEQMYGQGGFDENTGVPNAQGQEYIFNRSLTRSGGNIASAISGMNIMSGGQIDQGSLGLVTRAMELLPKEQQIGVTQQLLGQVQGAPQSLQTAELIKQLNEKLEQLTQATSANTSATSAMTDVLSPFYSQDPRSTHLGFRAFAGGGIMTQYGELPLRQYAGGGMATSPQVSVFGEGSTPEAYVPVPSGKIPVEIKTPANSNRPVNVTINVMGSADAGTVAALKQTGFQKAQQLRRITG